jgi:hypothetical protein
MSMLWPVRATIVEAAIDFLYKESTKQIKNESRNHGRRKGERNKAKQRESVGATDKKSVALQSLVKQRELRSAKVTQWHKDATRRSK